MVSGQWTSSKTSDWPWTAWEIRTESLVPDNVKVRAVSQSVRLTTYHDSIRGTPWRCVVDRDAVAGADSPDSGRGEEGAGMGIRGGEGDRSRLARAQRVDEACRRFEAEWRGGRGPRIEDYLGSAPGVDPDRAERLAELVALGLELRRAVGEQIGRAAGRGRG